MLEVRLGDPEYEVNIKACAAVESLTGVRGGGGGSGVAQPPTTQLPHRPCAPSSSNF